MGVTAESRYQQLNRHREAFIRRARECARLTIPSLMPEEGFNKDSRFYEPWSDTGARAVSFLASKLLTSLYPPGVSSFRLDIPPEALMAAGEDSTPPDIEAGLVKSQGLINREIERRSWRAPTNVALQHLIVCGNVGEIMSPDNRLRLYRLDQYVVLRDANGDLLEWIIAERRNADALPDRLRAMLGPSDSQDNQVTLYTWGKRSDDGWSVHQELANQEVPESRGMYSISPFMAYRWSAVLGEDYGRSKCDDHLPALRSIDGLAKSMREGAAMASRHYTLIRPSGGLQLRRKLAQAENGDFIIGDPEAVVERQFTNTNGLQIAQNELTNLRRELMAAFLMTSSVQRNGERVTATEWRELTEELDGALGGVYTALAQELQQHRLRRLILQMQGQQALPNWDDGMVEPSITTGFEALGRQQDVSKAQAAMNLIGTLPPEERVYVKTDVLLKKAFIGLDLADAVRTEAEVQEMRAQAQQQQMAAALAEQAGGAMIDAAAQQPQPME